MKPLDLAVRAAFLAEVRRRGVAAGEVWDCVKPSVDSGVPAAPQANGKKANENCGAAGRASALSLWQSPLSFGAAGTPPPYPLRRGGDAAALFAARRPR
jgi:hypothetical protein